ncbi:transcriptional regulator with XRE-family HTH domain [Lacrimispora xylanisolvens]|uniref:Transcriptional regulator with XRE-family HTH domain n=1 Tax=Lacrimispora xylanisolvens TaxID=384636 RepID=A0A2S6HQK6_9FIRM|nr:helix-turn-helix transcriptional regulator [Hungatella xylanolytica]PPK79885.1 transcriptional regulator with XRE-family HTH domain [Hungatella xylanolytica]
MYEVFEQLLQKYGVTPYKVAQKAGVTQTALSNWKSGRSTPSAKTLQKIADYFGVTVDYLMTGKEAIEKKSPDNDREQRLLEYARQLLDLGITPDDLAALIDLAEKMSKKE